MFTTVTAAISAGVTVAAVAEGVRRHLVGARFDRDLHAAARPRTL